MCCGNWRATPGRRQRDCVTAASSPAAAVRLFYSYAHEDEELRNELERKQLIAPWHDRRIVAGRDWDTEIDVNLRDAELMLLLDGFAWPS